MKTLLTLSMMAATCLLLSCSGAKKEQSSSPMYTEDWESLSKHNEEPEWFKDAKLGIYFHWGVYSVPAFGNEWYPRHMHFLDSRVRTAPPGNLWTPFGIRLSRFRSDV